MFKAFLNIWKVAELRTKILFTFAMLAIYRIGYFVPLPGVNQQSLADWAKNQSTGLTGQLVNFVGIFTGGSLSQSTVFGLGIMPYISASIIFQLMATVVPTFQAMQKEGPSGRQKIQEYTRMATIGLCIIQALFWIGVMRSQRLIYPDWEANPLLWICGVSALTAGTMFLMWLGEQIDKFGIGNGVSLIITAGIVSRIPSAIGSIAQNFSKSSGGGKYGFDTIVGLVFAFVVVVAGAILITQGQRRIPIQQAKHTRGRKVFGGQKTYLPLRVNHGGVMPIIFASSLMMFPTMAIGYFHSAHPNAFWDFLQSNFAMEHGYLWILVYIALIYFFAYFWTTVQFQPKEMATQLRDHGSFIPGLRPGPRTADYLETVMERITYVGAGFLAVIAVIPSLVHYFFNVDYRVSSFLGGTGLLIVVSVMLDFIQRIEASLMMRNYQGFLGSGGKIRGARGG